MLGKINAVANVAVKNLEVAKKFYSETLGLQPIANEGNELIVFRSGDTRINVYHSKFAGTNQATTVTWAVGDDVEKVVNDLKAKGIRFEHYNNISDMRIEGDIHIMGDMKVAWFKDPDGNILNIVNS